MTELTSFLLAHWFALAMTFSLFWGFRSAFLMTEKPHPSVSSGRFILADACPCLGIFFILSYQFIFNFVGSLAGWCCLYVLLVRITPQLATPSIISLADFFLFLFSVVGLTGHLPEMLYGFVLSVGRLAEGLAEAAKRAVGA